MENYYDNNDAGNFFEVGVQWSEELHKFHNDLPFSSERIKILKVEKLVANLRDRKWICYTNKNFKTSTKSRISLEKNA